MSKPIRDRWYLAWIRTQPCCVSRCQAHYIEAAHVGPHGLGQKASDRSTIPLCIRHHRTGDDSYHRLGPRKFARVHNLDIADIVRRLNTKPTIRIEAGRFVARLEEQEYTLSRVESGIQLAVREALRICQDHQLAQRGTV
jgi:hypothetical protein